MVLPAGARSFQPAAISQFQADGGQPASALNTGFGLNAKGGAVFLFRKAPQTNAVLDWIEYGLQTPDYSIGRVPSGSSRWVLTVPTPGDANVASALGDPLALRINEWMADPASGDDWFELYNRGTTPVDLSNLRLTDTYGNPDAYRIPALSFIGVDSNAFIRFEADEPAEPRGTRTRQLQAQPKRRCDLSAGHQQWHHP
jgi:hypothetical protein